MYGRGMPQRYPIHHEKWQQFRSDVGRHLRYYNRILSRFQALGINHGPMFDQLHELRVLLQGIYNDNRLWNDPCGESQRSFSEPAKGGDGVEQATDAKSGGH